MLAAPDVRVHRGGEHLGEGGQCRPGPVDPPPAARVDVSEGVGENVLPELLVRPLGADARLRRRTAQRLAGFWRQRLPGRPVGEPAVEGDDVVDHPVPEGAQRLPIVGVQPLFRTGWQVGAAWRFGPGPPICVKRHSPISRIGAGTVPSCDSSVAVPTISALREALPRRRRSPLPDDSSPPVRRLDRFSAGRPGLVCERRLHRAKTRALRRRP